MLVSIIFLMLQSLAMDSTAVLSVKMACLLKKELKLEEIKE